MNSSRFSYLAAALLTLAWILPAVADGPQDNIPANVRQIPPLGVELKPEEKEELEAGLKKLDGTIAELVKKKEAQKLLPDVEIFARAVRQGVQYRELFSQRDVDNAKKVLQEGLKRAEQLSKGESPWTKAKGLVVRGFRSKLDKTVQPYGLVIPESYVGEGKANYRLDIWLHGRNENICESMFITDRMSQAGRVVPKDTIVLHPFGRYSNAFKFAGEVDVFEALDHAKQNYRVDDKRVAIRGFSMGGAGCWQFAVHYPDRFFAANPGAGFSETKEFLRVFQKETLNPQPFEEKLWQMYDCPPLAQNLLHIPTVAYSGELDNQKQAADIMEAAMDKLGLKLTHLIGAQTKHDLHPETFKEVERKLADIAAAPDRFPMEVFFTTPTLKYNRCKWVEITGLKEHWKPAKVGVMIRNGNSVEIQSENVASLRLSIPAGSSPFNRFLPVTIISTPPSLKQTGVTSVRTESDLSWSTDLYLDGDAWKVGTDPNAKPDALVKKHNLQGPIDDAFLDSFIVVKPTGKARYELVDQWTNSEFEHCVREWRHQFRGDAIVKNDTQLTEADMEANNIVCFGDPASNKVIASVIERLPIQWTAEQVVVKDKRFAAAEHAPVLIYPNPLNPKRYIVLNSGFTYREYAYLNNARQIPKLPDWAVIDLRTPPDAVWPGKIAAADFFDEKWQVK